MKASDLYARLKQNQEYATALKDFWVGTFTSRCASPSSLGLQNMVRRFTLEWLVIGVEAYAAEISKKDKLVAEGKEPAFAVTTQNAVSYVCATAHNLLEREDPEKERPITERRFRNARINPDAYEWDSEAFHTASPEERRKMMAIIISREKAARGKQ